MIYFQSHSHKHVGPSLQSFHRKLQTQMYPFITYITIHDTAQYTRLMLPFDPFIELDLSISWQRFFSLRSPHSAAASLIS